VLLCIMCGLHVEHIYIFFIHFVNFYDIINLLLTNYKFKMVTKCCVQGCNTKAGQSIKLHRIPKGDIGDVWIQFFKKFNPLFNTSKNSVVCGLHFTDLNYACSSTSLYQTMLLKKNAVPSIISSYVPRSLVYKT